MGGRTSLCVCVCAKGKLTSKRWGYCNVQQQKPAWTAAGCERECPHARLLHACRSNTKTALRGQFAAINAAPHQTARCFVCLHSTRTAIAPQYFGTRCELIRFRDTCRRVWGRDCYSRVEKSTRRLFLHDKYKVESPFLYRRGDTGRLPCQATQAAATALARSGWKPRAKNGSVRLGM